MMYYSLIGFYLLIGILESINFKREYPEGNFVEVILTIITIPIIKLIGLCRRGLCAIAYMFS